jgi:hypothetical protein
MYRWLAVLIVPFVVSACGGGGGTNINAPGPVCTITVDNQNINIGFAAGNGVVTLQAAANCTWQAVSNAAFISITAGATGTGAGTIAFTVAENTGTTSRPGTITVTPNGGAAVVVTITQAAPPPPVVWNVPALPPATIGVPYTANLATATGGTGNYRYQLDTFGPFPPIALILGPDGVLSGTVNAATRLGVHVFRACAVDTTGRQDCKDIPITVQAATSGGGGAIDAALGEWSGTITLQVGCLTGLPRSFPWTGTFRRSGDRIELVVSVPFAFVSNEVLPVTITGTSLRFTIDFDSLYTFVATFSSDFRSLSGTFSGGNCNVPPTVVNPSGTWTGTKR